MKLFYLDSVMPFGKYKGFTIRQFCSGFPKTSYEFDQFYIKLFLRENVDCSLFTDDDRASIIVQFDKVKIDEGQGLILVCQSDKHKQISTGDLAHYFNQIFKQSQYLPDKESYGEVNRIILYGLRNTLISESVNNCLPFSCDLNYLKWCIEEIPNFVLHVDDMKELCAGNHYDFNGYFFDYCPLPGYLFYAPKIKEKPNKINERILELNIEKFEIWDNRQNRNHKSLEPNGHEDETDYFGGGCPVCESASGCLASDPDICPFA